SKLASPLKTHRLLHTSVIHIPLLLGFSDHRRPPLHGGPPITSPETTTTTTCFSSSLQLLENVGVKNVKLLYQRVQHQDEVIKIKEDPHKFMKGYLFLW
ncbi:hypothetical protein M8C21_022779, partial [Ambrosia artemisiifolia]